MTDALGTRYESDDASLGFMLWRVTNRWQSLMRRTLAPFDLTHVQFVLLAALTWSAQAESAPREGSAPAEGITQTELANIVRADPMMVSQVLRALEAKGLVERRKDAHDKRAVRVIATSAGVAAARAANHAVEDADDAFFGAESAGSHSLLTHLTRLDETRRS